MAQNQLHKSCYVIYLHKSLTLGNWQCLGGNSSWIYLQEGYYMYKGEMNRVCGFVVLALFCLSFFEF